MRTLCFEFAISIFTRGIVIHMYPFIWEGYTGPFTVALEDTCEDYFSVEFNIFRA